MVRIPLEDNVVDVLIKAQKGAGLSDTDLARLAKISREDLAKTKDGDWQETSLRRLAQVLHLGENSLVELAQKAWQPEALSVEGLAQFNTRLSDMTVNSYLTWDTATRDAVAFDTGANAFGLMATLRTQNLNLRYLLLTHTHGDHVADLDRVRSESKAEIWVSAKEPYPGAQSFSEGHRFAAGRLKIQTRSTIGHSAGGTSFVIEGLARPVAVVGDALFAASMGGGKVSYRSALETNRSQLFSLPDDCVLCPGHGPMTTVGWEKKHNPFFPEFQ
jgi:hydroxyacylglutathione hydrolase